MDRVSNSSGGADTPDTGVEVKEKNEEKIVDNKEKDNSVDKVNPKKVINKKPAWKKQARSPTLFEQRRILGKHWLLALCMDNHC